MAWLVDSKSVVNGVEKRMRANLGGFERTSDIYVNICAQKAEGFTFEYITNDADIKQVGKILSFKAGIDFVSFIPYNKIKDINKEALCITY